MRTATARTFGRGRRRLPLPLYLVIAAFWLVAGCPISASSDAAPAPVESPGAPPYLIVQRVEGGVLVRISLAHDGSWVLKWNHSVTGIEVSDYYVYEEGTMLLEASHTPAFDAGLGHIPGRGRLESDGRGGYWIRDIDEPVAGNAYRLRVGAPAVDHRIVHGALTVSLSEIAAGEAVVIRVDDR